MGGGQVAGMGWEKVVRVVGTGSGLEFEHRIVMCCRVCMRCMYVWLWQLQVDVNVHGVLV